MVLIPESSIVSEVSSIIASSQLIEDFNWKFLKDRLAEWIYEDMIDLTLEKYLNLNRDYIMVANKYEELLKNSRKGL